MDLISAFKSELFRPLATVIAPGTIAIAPWEFIFIAENSFIVPYIEDYPIASAFIFIALVTVAAFILENIGARIEARWDKLLAKSDSTHSDSWNKYLQLKIKDEIVGQRYLRTIVTRMKFELAISPALTSCLFGLITLNEVKNYWTCGSMIAISISLVLLSTYLFYESFCSVKICANARDQILKSVEN